MSARVNATEPASPASSAARFNSELFDELCLAKDPEAVTEVAKAALAGVDVTTLYRWRRDHFRPRHDIADRIAALLGTTIDELWPRSA